MSVCQKLGIILENKEVQKLKLVNNVLTKKWSPKLIFLDNFFLTSKLTLKVQFWHFLTNRN